MNARDRDPLPNCHARHIRAQGVDGADRFRAADGRQLGLVAIAATHRPEVVIVDRRQDGPDAYLTGTGLRDGAVRNDQDVGRFAKRGVNVAAHDVSLHSGDVQAHIDVITCRIGIGADLMRRLDQVARRGLIQTGEFNMDVDVQLEPAIRQLADTDFG